MIFIRLASGGKNDEARFETAFQDVPTDKWKIFSDAKDLPEKLFEDESSDNDQPNTNNDDVDCSPQNHSIIQSKTFPYHLLFILSIFIFIIE